MVFGIPVTKSGNVEEYDKAIDWYVHVLGFNLIWKMGIASLKLDNGQEILLFGEETDENSLWYASGSKLHSIQFTTDDIKELRTKLVQSGVEVGEITMGGGGDQIMNFYDPHGNRFWAIQEQQ